MTAAESEERLRRLKDNERVVAELTADAAGGTRKLEDHFDPEGHEGVTAWYLWLAWRCRQTEHANWFVVFIMTVIITASILVGVNTYEFDSMGQQLLSDSAKRVLDTMEVIILVIFWMELTLKAVGCGLKPWRFFFVAWCACRPSPYAVVIASPLAHAAARSLHIVSPFAGAAEQPGRSSTTRQLLCAVIAMSR
jgi:hypothetical protein